VDFNLKERLFLACKRVLPVMERQGGGAIGQHRSTSGLRWTGSAQVAYAPPRRAVIQPRASSRCSDAERIYPRELRGSLAAA